MTKHSTRIAPGPTTPQKRHAPVPRDPRVLENRLEPKQTPAAAAAVMAVEGIGMNAVLADSFSSKLGAVDVTELMTRLTLTAERVATGAREDLEKILAAQSVALNAIFTELALVARQNITTNIEVFERLIRIALKAQSQSRATAESIALMQTPTVFARQANIANGPQQINNGLPTERVARARNSGSRPNRLLEADGERLDAGTPSKAGNSNQDLATMGAIDRPQNGRR